MTTHHSKETVAILDCGAQYTKVIDRRIRELCVNTAILPIETSPDDLVANYSAIILSGGPNSVYDSDSPKCHPDLFKCGLPILGICYGMQLMNHTLGGSVVPSTTKEYGETIIQAQSDSLLFNGLEPAQQVLMSHGDSVGQLAPGFRQIASSDNPNHGAPIVAAIEDAERRLYGVQFHPEVELSTQGTQMLANFLFRIARLSGSYKLDNRLDQAIETIQKQVGNQPVFVLVSGGVDSSVTAALLVKALGPEQVYAVHIDSGFMRHQESDLVCDALQAIGLKHLRRMNAQQQFLTGKLDSSITGFEETGLPLNQVTHPETKRRIIGDVFYYCITQAISDMHLDMSRTFIAQGTLRPDLIESGNRDVSSTAHTIKTHHNDVPLIREQREKGLIIEPNRDWHKDEVRQIGRMLGLPEALVARQPFPGPGLAIRILCANEPYITPEFDTLQTRLTEATRPLGWQGTLLPVRSVGVQGDARSYSYVAAISGPTHETPWESLATLARDIPNRIPGINRVVLVLNKPQAPDTVREVTRTTLTPETTDKLRLLDHIVTSSFDKAGLMTKISQLLTVLVPVDTSGDQGHSVAIRGVVTSDFMTARPARLGDEIPWTLMQHVTQQLANQPGVDLVMYDLTSKPPATVEWE